jgi:formylglycine-generating enzyme required for sulfatase activity
MHRRQFIKTLVAAGAASLGGGYALDANPSEGTTSGGAGTARPGINPRANLIAAPDDRGQWDAFRDALTRWRTDTRARIGYDDALYRQDDLTWASSCYCCCFVMMCDQTFYDAGRGSYKIEAFLRHGTEEFGGYDALVLWHAYPRIGIDHRNQFDFYREMPGGLAGLRAAAGQCHARGVKVFIDYNPWDTGTRREDCSDVDALVSLVKAIDADGIFLDTMNKGAAEFRRKLDAARPGVVLESELALPLENIHDHHMSWAQWFSDSEVPGVLRNKWFERRHMQHQVRRWDRDHTPELHTAWMNGSGMMVWENVFGTWVGWCGRDRSILRAMLPIQRRYRRLFCGEGWTPLVPTEQPEVYCSLWEGEQLRLWTLVNRSEKPVRGVLLKVPHVEGGLYFDVVSGLPAGRAIQEGPAVLSGTITGRGIGAFICGSRQALGEDFRRFLAAQRQADSHAPLDSDFPARRTVLVTATPTKKYTRQAIPTGMVEIPPAEFEMKVEFRIRECGFYESVPETSNTWGALHESGLLTRRARVGRYAIDLAPVTNVEYAEFLRATGYRPAHPENFLRHWTDGAPTAGSEDHPVVYVDLDDARAYAKWAGKRLCSEEEWQYAAQGPRGLRYPWGDKMSPGLCNAGEGGRTTSVKAFDGGRSAFGCYDMCGNTWEWTESERSDGRTRFCIIRGGSFYRAEGSAWYADGGPRPCNFAAKFLLMWPGLDRCATIGFRCAADLDD